MVEAYYNLINQDLIKIKHDYQSYFPNKEKFR